MGTSNGKPEVEELVRRCEAVGWQVSKTAAGHWKVDTRKGIFTISSTPGNTRSVMNSLADARRRGLEELEAKLVRNDDRNRLRKIQADREANDAKLARMTEKVRTFSRTGQVEFREPISADPTVDLGFGHVNGIAIVAIAPALIKTPVMDDAAPLADAEELLLANEAIVYRCRKKGPWGSNDDVLPGQFCNSVFSAARSLQAHISFHARRAARDSMSALSAADQEKERKVEEVVKTASAVEVSAAVIAAPSPTTDELKRMLTESLTSLVAAIDKIGASSIEARNVLLKLVDQVQALKPEVVVQEPDPELVAKAAQFDQLAATLGNLIKPVR